MSAMTRSMPYMSSSGNPRPQSMMMMSLPYSRTVIFLPISLSPPRGMIFNFSAKLYIPLFKNSWFCRSDFRLLVWNAQILRKDAGAGNSCAFPRKRAFMTQRPKGRTNSSGQLRPLRPRLVGFLHGCLRRLCFLYRSGRPIAPGKPQAARVAVCILKCNPSVPL